jgi:hypothetical protein
MARCPLVLLASNQFRHLTKLWLVRDLNPYLPAISKGVILCGIHSHLRQLTNLIKK